jgi:GTP-binding protein
MADIPGIIGGASDGKGLGIEFLKHIERTKTLLFMVDLASYRDLSEQIETLKKEVSKFSDVLGTSAYAIALTRADIVPPQEVAQKVTDFITSQGLAPTSKSKFQFDDTLPYFIQESADETLGYDKTKPYFIAPISSATGKNIEAIKYALFDLVDTQRKANTEA